MTTEWTPILVALVGGLLLIPPAVITLIGGRAEPRRLRELKSLNEVLRDLPVEDDSYEGLSAYRTAVATAYGGRAVRLDPGVIVMTPLIVGWLLGSAGVFLIGSRGKSFDQVLDSSLVWAGNLESA